VRKRTVTKTPTSWMPSRVGLMTSPECTHLNKYFQKYVKEKKYIFTNIMIFY